MKKLVYLALLVAVGFVVGCKQEDASTAAEKAAKEAGATTNAPAPK
jgi:outer membrane lipoprotein-sorting protein